MSSVNFFILAFLIVALIYFWLIIPGMAMHQQMEQFNRRFVAHRGLFDNESDAPENTMAAFRKAVEAGYGIEMDVQMTKDEQLVIFHDWDLKRMAGVDWKVTEHTYEELKAYTLGKSNETIPLFEDVLHMVDGRVPLVVEIKVALSYKKTTKAVARMLNQYRGDYCIECFNPFALQWYKKHEPDIMRGLLAMDFSNEPIPMPRFFKFIMSNMMLNFVARPNFISFQHCDKRKLSFRLCKKIFHAKTAAWVIKSQQELLEAKETFDFFIFDSFIPTETENSDTI